MGTNKDQTPESGGQASYEAAVLDFLDREMAAVQPNKKPDEPGQEVDALVTDLLKQVITESDQPNGGLKAVSGSAEDMLSEFQPGEAEKTPPGTENLESTDKAASPPTSRNLKSPHEAADHPTEQRRDVPAKPAKETQAGAPFNPRIPNFGMGMAPRRKIPMIAAASVCLLVIIGAAVYYLMGSPRSEADTLELQPTATISLVPFNRTAPVDSQKQNAAEAPSLSPARKPVASPKILPKTKNRPPAVPSSGSVRAPSAQGAADPETAPVRAAVADRSTNPISDEDSAHVIVKPSTAQTLTPSPLKVASNLDIDRPAVPPMPDGIALANPTLEKSPAQSVSAVLSGIGDPALTSQAQTPVSVGSRSLVPSVLISQVSPAYPELAIRSRISGSVVLELRIDEEGRVLEATPISGPSVFYSEGVKAAMQYRYRPATLDGVNVSSKSRVTMVFNLNR